ncbi:hypothetical protein BC936DRAFT_149538 [Jimgerdemannia flammicorona]|uniref:Uncharacterized protein n=1 Tax=Jimgerdemannia flammicorona TaxID=994334 RepID=A0A433D0N3_9FUNG|nr:hypothetical protein BC936DRAFT_149538 [Jimgerdemannia flammicorona]
MPNRTDRQQHKHYKQNNNKIDVTPPLPPRNPFSCNTLPHHHHTTRVKNPFTFLDSLHNPLLLKRKHDDDDDDDDDNDNNNDNDNNSNSSRDRDRDHDYDHGSTSDESMEAALPSEDDDYDIEDVCSNHSRRRAPVGLAFDAYQDKQDTWPDEEVNVDNQAEEIGHDSDQGQDVKRKNKTLLKLLQKPKPTLGSQNTSEDLLDLEWLSIGSSTSSEPITKTKVCPPGSSVAHWLTGPTVRLVSEIVSFFHLPFPVHVVQHCGDHVTAGVAGSGRVCEKTVRPGWGARGETGCNYLFRWLYDVS